nr:unnamed protein product [Digitaria exilis]
MEYDFRGRQGSGSYGGPPPGSAPGGGGGGSSLYPRVGQPSHGGGGGGGATASPRVAPYHHGPGGGPGSSAPIVTPLAPTSSAASSKVGIQVGIKPEFRITPPVKEFVRSYNILHEMGFTSSNVPELLAIHDNDPDKVIQRLLSSPS